MAWNMSSLSAICKQTVELSCREIYIHRFIEHECLTLLACVQSRLTGRCPRRAMLDNNLIAQLQSTLRETVIEAENQETGEQS